MNTQVNNIRNNKIARLVTTIVVAALAIAMFSGGSAVAGKLLTGKNIKNSSLTGADIKNGSVGTNDLTGPAKAAMTGAKGDPGDSGLIAFNSSSTAQLVEDDVFTNLTNGSVDVNVPAGQSTLLIQFSAECSVTHPSQYVRNYVRVRVDGVTTSAPSDSAFCSNTDDTDHDAYVGASIQRVVNVAPGAHTVQVQFRPDSADGVARIDDSVLTVQTGK